MTTKTKPRKTKKAQLIQLLSAKTGANVETLSGKLGWQSHTTRAAITGLRKAGFEILTEKGAGKPTTYRIAGKPDGAAKTETLAANAGMADAD